MFPRTALPLILLLTVAAQQGLNVPALSAPTKTAAKSTPEETAILREGIALFEQRKYDEAYLKFDRVRQASPDNTTAIYEMALVHHAKKEYQAAIDLGAQCTMYISDAASLALCYSLIGNTLDAVRDPKRAVEVYAKGLEVAPAASLYYNKAVTQAQSLSDIAGAKASLKAGARLEPAHAGTHMMLGRLFAIDDLKTPAILALSRFLILEPASPRTPEAYQLWFRLLAGTLTAPKGPDGAANITVDMNQKKDEGDLTQMDFHIALSRLAASKAGAQEKPQIQIMADQLHALIGVWVGRGAGVDNETFLWSYYMPYFSEMQKQNLVEPFVYYVSQRTDLPGVREWLTANRERVVTFLDWSRKFTFK
jgi:tetratricopeptide (TPR) repeat protein